MEKLRAPAYPLVTVDPYFSIWSCSNNLNDEVTRHWSGARQNMLGIIRVDGKYYKFMGSTQSDCTYPYEPEKIEQTDVKVTPLNTVYTFQNQMIQLKVTFMTPLILENLHLLSRPVSYISYEIQAIDDARHDVQLYIGASSEISVDRVDEVVSINSYKNGISCGKGNKDVLTECGDRKRINWGKLHLFSQNHEPLCMATDRAEFRFKDNQDIEDQDKLADGQQCVCHKTPLLLLRKSYVINREITQDFVCIGYDDIKSAVYFGKKLNAYYKKDGDTFEMVCEKALNEYAHIVKEADEFEQKLLCEARKISEKYADIVSLAYRQTIAAHKLTWDGEEVQFFSKECNSNGCMATVDVTYPSITLFLIYNPQLVQGMLNPVFKYVKSGEWKFPYAPHDLGRYPQANGQVYGLDEISGQLREQEQMPVEECGNMIISVTALCKAQNSMEYFTKNRDILEQWAKYLVKHGLDPENQLCTDDFAGHLAHNSNLSIKAIVGIGCFGHMLQRIGETGERYTSIAKEYAKQWEIKADDGTCYRLAFDKEGTWSIKYNLMWDKIFKLGLFSDEVYKKEIEFYKGKMREYGLPLDSRSDYSKSDWQMWTIVLTDDEEYKKMIIERMWQMLNETESRVPFSDWYYCTTAKHKYFQNRSVQGALYAPLLILIPE